MLFIPPLILGLLIGTMLAAAIHLWRGQTVREFALFWAVAQVGFWSAQFVAQLWPSFTLTSAGIVGELDIALGLFCGTFALGVMIVRQKRV